MKNTYVHVRRQIQIPRTLTPALKQLLYVLCNTYCVKCYVGHEWMYSTVPLLRHLQTESMWLWIQTCRCGSIRTGDDWPAWWMTWGLGAIWICSCLSEQERNLSKQDAVKAPAVASLQRINIAGSSQEGSNYEESGPYSFSAELW